MTSEQAGLGGRLSPESDRVPDSTDCPDSRRVTPPSQYYDPPIWHRIGPSRFTGPQQHFSLPPLTPQNISLCHRCLRLLLASSCSSLGTQSPGVAHLPCLLPVASFFRSQIIRADSIFQALALLSLLRIPSLQLQNCYTGPGPNHRSAGSVPVTSILVGRSV
eukprot:767973-Hanusia_phi.AAC.4